jgi:hypothetical protein
MNLICNTFSTGWMGVISVAGDGVEQENFLTFRVLSRGLIFNLLKKGFGKGQSWRRCCN